MTQTNRKIIMETEKLQGLIRQKYSDRIGKARQRLCRECKNAPCFLLPITSNGEDCPYFLERIEQ